jgi:hypothetical protein
MRRPSRRAFVEQQIAQQERWIREHGQDLAGYILRYGDPGMAECYGSGGTKIYEADMNELTRLRAALARLPKRAVTA